MSDKRKRTELDLKAKVALIFNKLYKIQMHACDMHVFVMPVH